MSHFLNPRGLFHHILGLFLLGGVSTPTLYAELPEADFCREAVSALGRSRTILEGLTPTWTEGVHELSQSDAIISQIQALSRVIHRAESNPRLGKIRARVTQVARALEKYKRMYEIEHSLTKAHLPKKVFARLSLKTEKALDRTSVAIQKWIPLSHAGPHPVEETLAMLEEHAKSFSTQDYKNIVIASLIKDLKAIRDADYDLRDLKSGLREYERNLRLVLITIASFPGLFETQEVTAPKLSNLKAFEALSESNRLSHPWYSDPPKSHVRNPIVLPKASFLALARSVEALSEVLQKEESRHALSKAYKESRGPVTDATINRHLPSNLRQMSGEPTGELIHKMIADNKLLDSLIKSLEDQIEEER
jgi:hypothetical protein